MARRRQTRNVTAGQTCHDGGDTPQQNDLGTALRDLSRALQAASDRSAQTLQLFQRLWLQHVNADGITSQLDQALVNVEDERDDEDGEDDTDPQEQEQRCDVGSALDEALQQTLKVPRDDNVGRYVRRLGEEHWQLDIRRCWALFAMDGNWPNSTFLRHLRELSSKEPHFPAAFALLKKAQSERKAKWDAYDARQQARRKTGWVAWRTTDAKAALVKCETNTCDGHPSGEDQQNTPNNVASGDEARGEHAEGRVCQEPEQADGDGDDTRESIEMQRGQHDTPSPAANNDTAFGFAFDFDTGEESTELHLRSEPRLSPRCDSAQSRQELEPSTPSRTPSAPASQSPQPQTTPTSTTSRPRQNTMATRSDTRANVPKRRRADDDDNVACGAWLLAVSRPGAQLISQTIADVPVDLVVCSDSNTALAALRPNLRTALTRTRALIWFSRRVPPTLYLPNPADEDAYLGNELEAGRSGATQTRDNGEDSLWRAIVQTLAQDIAQIWGLANASPPDAEDQQSFGEMLEFGEPTICPLIGPESAALSIRIAATAAHLAFDWDLPATMCGVETWSRCIQCCADRRLSFDSPIAASVGRIALAGTMCPVVGAVPANVDPQPIINRLEEYARLREGLSQECKECERVRAQVVQLRKEEQSSNSETSMSSHDEVTQLQSQITSIEAWLAAPSIRPADAALWRATLADFNQRLSSFKTASQVEGIQRSRKSIIERLGADIAYYKDDMQQISDSMNDLCTDWEQAFAQAANTLSQWHSRSISKE